MAVLSRVPSLLLCLLITACSNSIAGSRTNQPGVIAFYSEPVVAEVPDTVQAGVPFEVAIRTYGGGCIRQGDTDVEVDGLSVRVVPHDEHTGADVCTSELRYFDHRSSVEIARPGRAEIRFEGREMPADSTLVVTREVVVR